MEIEFLDALEEDWQPVSRRALTAWLLFYGAFMLYAWANKDGFLITDYIFLPIHEGGHLLFRWFGEVPMVMGGTLLQLLVPFLLAVYFVFQRHTTGTALCAFFFFENFLNVAIYMADARAQALQYVTVGDPEFAEHDWFVMFSSVGLLDRDTSIAAGVRLLGWLGMLGVVAWLVKRARAAPRDFR